MIFTDENDRQAAISHLPMLKDHPAWKYIERALDENIAHFTGQLRTRKDFKTLEELSHLQDRIDDVEEFKNLPATLLRVAQNVLPEQEDSDDPFLEQPAESDQPTQ